MTDPRIQLTPLTVDADSMLLAQYGALMTSNADRINLPPGEAARSSREHVQALGDPGNRNIRFAIVSGDVVVGRLDLVPVEPPRFSIGYWLGREHTRQGLATSAVLLAAEHARGHLRATDLYAGVKKGNHASTRVLTKAGFTHVADQGTYDRFHLPPNDGLPRDVNQARPSLVSRPSASSRSALQ